MEELLQIILQWSPCQQQLMIYLVAIEDPEKLEDGARKGRRKGQVVNPQHRPFPAPCSRFPQNQRPQIPGPLPLLTWTSPQRFPGTPPPRLQEVPRTLRTTVSGSPQPQVSQV